MAGIVVTASPTPHHVLQRSSGGIPTTSPNLEKKSSGSANCRQIMSPSPEKDNAADPVDPKSSDVQANPKKRSSSDAVEYPRRRATIAVCNT
jgi:hypothetical protein